MLILFLKAKLRGDDRTSDMFGGSEAPGLTRVKGHVRKDGVFVAEHNRKTLGAKPKRKAAPKAKAVEDPQMGMTLEQGPEKKVEPKAKPVDVAPEPVKSEAEPKEAPLFISGKAGDWKVDPYNEAGAAALERGAKAWREISDALGARRDRPAAADNHSGTQWGLKATKSAKSAEVKALLSKRKAVEAWMVGKLPKYLASGEPVHLRSDLNGFYRSGNLDDAMAPAKSAPKAAAKPEAKAAEVEKKADAPKPKTRLAPNGKPSNLNARQWEQVRTPEFKAWFGDWESDPENASKVVDENGEPLVVYHGTGADIERMRKLWKIREEDDTEVLEHGPFFFTASAAVASGYADASKRAGGPSASPNVVPCFLSMTNVVDVDAKGGTWLAHNNEAMDRRENDGAEGIVMRNIKDNTGESEGVTSMVLIAFSPSQIKSAIGNSGAYSKDDDHLTKSQPLYLFFKANIANRAGMILVPITDRSGRKSARWRKLKIPKATRKDTVTEDMFDPAVSGDLHDPAAVRAMVAAIGKPKAAKAPKRDMGPAPAQGAMDFDAPRVVASVADSPAGFQVGQDVIWTAKGVKGPKDWDARVKSVTGGAVMIYVPGMMMHQTVKVSELRLKGEPAKAPAPAQVDSPARAQAAGKPSFTKLKSGEWGVRVPSETVKSGDRFSVTKKSGGRAPSSSTRCCGREMGSPLPASRRRPENRAKAAGWPTRTGAPTSMGTGSRRMTPRMRGAGCRSDSETAPCGAVLR